ncbi:MAG: hypothetical protein AB7V36_12775 [Bacteroidales bacterium]
MKKLAFKIAIIAFSAFLISSCGNSKKDNKADENNVKNDSVEQVAEAPVKTINSENFKILSNAKDYIKVVPGEYKPYEKDGYIYIEVKFELLKKYTGNSKQVWIDMTPKNKDGGKVKYDQGIGVTGPVGDGYGERVLEFIKSEPGETLMIECVGYLEDSNKNAEGKAKEYIDDLNSFEVKFKML